jgi:lysozyme
MPNTLASARGVPALTLTMLERFEGLHDGDKKTPNLLEPQADPIGIYTVGYGYALFENGKPVKDKERAYRIWRARWPHGMTLADAKALLRATAQDVCDRVLRLLSGVTLSDGELSALICLAYNIGVGEVGGVADFADSTVRHKLLASDRRGAADAFRMWVKAAGKTLPGLVTRREDERRVFLGGAL